MQIFKYQSLWGSFLFHITADTGTLPALKDPNPHPEAVSYELGFQPGVGEGSTSTLGSLQPSGVNWVWSCRPATLLLVCYSSCEEFLCSFQGLCTLWKECHVPVCLAEDWEVVNWYWWIEGFLWQSEQSSCSFIRDFFLWGMMTFLIYIVCKAELTIWRQNPIMPMEIYLVAFKSTKNLTLCCKMVYIWWRTHFYCTTQYLQIEHTRITNTQIKK